MPIRVHTVQLLASIYDDGTVRLEVAIPSAGDGTDEDGRPTPLGEAAYVTLMTLNPGQSQRVVDRLGAVRKRID